MGPSSLSIIVFLGACCSLALSQSRNIPTTISSCYQNITAYNRFTRQPMHIENLIAIIRKIEQKTFYQWDARRVSRTILKEYRFDGMSYDPDKRAGLQFETDPLEDHRAHIVDSLIAGGDDRIPEGVLDNDEKCALHWMLSHSINATLRDEEVYRGRTYLRAKRSAEAPKDDYYRDDGRAEYENEEPVSRNASETKNDSRSDADFIDNLPVDSDYQGDSEPYNPDGLLTQRLTNLPTTKQPLETGVVFTRWGAVAAGQLLAGIAAGLEPATLPITVTSDSVYNVGGNVPSFSGSNSGNPSQSWSSGFNSGNSNNWGSNNWGNSNNFGAQSQNRWQPYPQPAGRLNPRFKRQASYLQPLQNVYAATLAGDVGQAAILNAVYSNANNAQPPVGTFNDTICPREYIMDALQDPNADVSHAHDTWSYMTAAEIRGGVDGLLLGLRMKDWDNMNKFRLSELLSMYYSERGVVGEIDYRACNRGAKFGGAINTNDILEQAKSFAYVYNNRTQQLKVATAENIQTLYDLVQNAFQKMMGYASSLSGLDPTCTGRSSAAELPDSDKTVVPQYTVYAVLDHTDTTDPELNEQKRFVANLAYELKVSPYGSRVGLVNGATGQILIKPNWTDNAAAFACRALGERTFTQTQMGLATAMNNIKTELERTRDEGIRTDYMDNNGIIILVLNQGKKLDDSLRDSVMSNVYEFERAHGDVHVVYATSKYQAGDYQNFALNQELDVIRIQTSTNISSDAPRFAQELAKRNHGRLTYARCNQNQYDQNNEHQLGTDLLISSNTIQYYKISPDYFYSARYLRLRFSSENGKVRVCHSRWNRFPSSLNVNQDDVRCSETSGQYQPAGSSTSDVEIPYDKPCGGDGDRDGCSPIYLSITPTSLDNSILPTCMVDKCQYSDQVKVTFSHYDMRCNSAVHMLLSLPTFLASIAFIAYTFAKHS